MLVLSRKVDEITRLSVSAEDILRLAEKGERLDINVMLVECRGEKVRVGFEAPQCVQILRDDAIRTEPTHLRSVSEQSGERGVLAP